MDASILTILQTEMLKFQKPEQQAAIMPKQHFPHQRNSLPEHKLPEFHDCSTCTMIN
jgi:hypothetical protein